MFKQSKAPCLSPRGQYDFKVEFIPDAKSQESRVIPLPPTENEVLEMTIDGGPAAPFNELYFLESTLSFSPEKEKVTSNLPLTNKNSMLSLL